MVCLRVQGYKEEEEEARERGGGEGQDEEEEGRMKKKEREKVCEILDVNYYVSSSQCLRCMRQFQCSRSTKWPKGVITKLQNEN